MRRLLLASVAILALGAASPALADDAAAAAGGSVGGATGATAGFFIGGPVGAVIGGFTGAVLGASAGVSATSVEYVDRHPVEPVALDEQIGIGDQLGADITIHPIVGDPAHGYIYANGRAYIVQLSDRAIVQSPGYYVPKKSADYARNNPTASITVDGDVVPGYKLHSSVKLGALPGDNTYSYIYINDHPAMVDNRSHIVVWIGE